MRDKQKTIGAASGAIGMGGAAAFLSACCVTPWAVGLLGAAGAVTLARLSFLQPFFLAGAVLLLSATFWFAYRPLPASDNEPCETRSRVGLRWVAWTAAAIVAVLVVVSRIPSVG